VEDVEVVAGHAAQHLGPAGSISARGAVGQVAHEAAMSRARPLAVVDRPKSQLAVGQPGLGAGTLCTMLP
jgi:hypothetical protein